jgi:imidazolonepropionase-like amidohydrolase
MHGRPFTTAFVVALSGALALGFHATARGQQPPPRTTLFEGARLIVGNNTAPIERSAFVVQGNRITALGRQGEVTAPSGASRVDLTGKTVMPAIVDTHSHLGYFDEVADKEMADEFTRARVLDHLDRFAFTGHAVTYSLGSDAPTSLTHGIATTRSTSSISATSRNAIRSPVLDTSRLVAAWPGLGREIRAAPRSIRS